MIWKIRWERFRWGRKAHCMEWAATGKCWLLGGSTIAMCFLILHSCCRFLYVFLFRKDMSENKRRSTCIDQLPEECHIGKLNAVVWKPWLATNRFLHPARMVAGKTPHGKAIHESNGRNGDRAIHAEGMALLKSTMRIAQTKSKLGYNKEVKDKCDWSHDHLSMKSVKEHAVCHTPCSGKC